MGGFEVAGVVLGAWPILEQGLRFYRARSRDIFRHEEVMNEFIRKLHVEHSRFRFSCERLIHGLADDNELKSLLDSATEHAWKKALKNGLDKKLRNKLDFAFHGYTQTVLHVARNLLILGNLVDLERQSKPSWRDKTKYRKPKWHAETWKRIKDCLDHDRHAQLLAEIDEDNTYLEKLTPGMAESEPIVASRPRRADISHWECVRRSAKSLYCALCSGWLCQCQDAHEDTHAARLRLEDRTSPTTTRHRFKVAFSYAGSGNAVTSARVTWQETEVEPEEEDEEEVAGRVRFAQSATPQSSAPSTAPLTNRQITSLCHTLHQCHGQRNPACIGFLNQEKHKHYIHLVGPASPQAVNRRAISLYELLQHHGRVTSPISLAIELLDKYELAVILASSLLQLHTTSWLRQRWTAQDIQFVPTNPDAPLGRCAFVVKSFSSAGAGDGADASSGNDSPIRQLAIKNEAIFALGATLVELSIAATLESKRTEADREARDLADVCTAQRLAQQVRRNNVREWNSVVDKCLRCGFQAAPDFGRPEFRQEFYESVVGPLQKLYEDARPDDGRM